MRKIAAFFADTHAGHKLGLMSPETRLFEEGAWYHPALSETQKYLWAKYWNHRGAVWNLAAGSPVNVFHVGDVTHGDTHPEQLVSTRAGDQFLIGIANMRPWLQEGADSLRLAQGTGAHVFKEGSATMVVTDSLKSEFPEKDINMVTHSIANFDGYRIDYAHHGPSAGTRSWTSGSALRYYVKDRMLKEILHGMEPPDAIIRAHYHTYAHEVVEVTGHKTWRCEAWILPCYCGLSDYARKSARSPYRVDLGMLALEIVDGKLAQVLPLIEKLKVVKEETF